MWWRRSWTRSTTTRRCEALAALSPPCSEPRYECVALCAAGGRTSRSPSTRHPHPHPQLLLPSTEMAVDAAEESFRNFSDKWFDMQQRQALGAAHTTLRGEAVELRELRGRLKRLGACSCACFLCSCRD